MEENSGKINKAGITVEVLFILLFFFFFTIWPFTDVDTNVKAALIAGLFGLLGWTIQHEYQKIRDYQQQLHEMRLDHAHRISQIRLQNYDTRKEMYDELLQPFITMFQVTRSGEKVDLNKMSEQMNKNTIQVHLLGSDEACKAWEDWFQLSLKLKDERDPERIKLMQTYAIILYARIVLSIRKDLGNEATILREVDFLRAILTDIETQMDLFTKAQKIKSISDLD